MQNKILHTKSVNIFLGRICVFVLSSLRTFKCEPVRVRTGDQPILPETFLCDKNKHFLWIE